MKEQEMPKNNFPQQEYESYFAIWQNKAAWLSDIYKQNYHLGNAVRRFEKEGKLQFIRQRRQNGKMDKLVRAISLEPNTQLTVVPN